MAALMLQGTGSDVGKTVLVAGLCRALANRGLRVRPMKPQNMSNNTIVLADGSEISRAQQLQALACRAAPTSDMNPVLLKPEQDFRSALVVHGRPAGAIGGADFRHRRAHLLAAVLESYRRLAHETDIVVVEGAGSPAEINLRAGDIANMGFARAAGVPVVLVGDINRGGVIAAIAGTRAVLHPDDAAMIRGFIINKFRGTPALFVDGYRAIERHTRWSGFGIVPWLGAASRLPEEDGIPATAASPHAALTIVCPVLPRSANLDAFAPLRHDEGIAFRFAMPGRPLPLDADLVVLAHSANPEADLQTFLAEGWDIDLRAIRRAGGRIIGIGAGYQMLGTEIATDGAARRPGLGLLNVTTTAPVAPHPVHATGTLLGDTFSGTFLGSVRAAGGDSLRPSGTCDGAPDGATSADGRVVGTSWLRPFATESLRQIWFARVGAGASIDHFTVDAALDEIADALEEHLAIDRLIALAGDAHAAR